MRVLHGVSGAANQPFTLSRAQRSLGVQSDCVLFGINPYGFKADYQIESATTTDQFDFLQFAIRNYDVFHFYYRSIIRLGTVARVFPSGSDLLALRAAGKVVVMHYRGSEVRSREIFDEINPYSYSAELPGMFEKWPRQEIDNFRNLVLGTADIILCADEELRTYVPEAKVINRALNLSNVQPVGPRLQNGAKLFVHAPTRPIVKGSHFIDAAFSEMHKNGTIASYRKVQNFENTVAMSIYSDATIAIDQLRIGWYGVFAVEAMALGKPTICYIREDLLSTHEDELPIINANPKNIRQVLEMVNDESLETLKIRGDKGRSFVEQHHDATKIARQLLELYEEALSNPRQSSRPDLIVDFLKRQALFTEFKRPPALRRLQNLIVERGWRYGLLSAINASKVRLRKVFHRPKFRLLRRD